MKYIAKYHTWFDEGTVAIRLTDFWEGFSDSEMTKPVRTALFQGIRCGFPDEEICCECEFDVVE